MHMDMHSLASEKVFNTSECIFKKYSNKSLIYVLKIIQQTKQDIVVKYIIFRLSLFCFYLFILYCVI